MEKESMSICHKQTVLRSKRANFASNHNDSIVVMGSILFAFLLTLLACSRNRGLDALLDTADSLMNIRPDSVIQILEPLDGEKEKMNTSQEMRRLLLLTSAYNKCYMIFSSDSVQLILTEYYDKHGTPNERMLAHYLLGRARSDMGEAPEAMRNYQEAVVCADTTSVDCDWWNLSRICLQLADEYYGLYMPMEMKEALRLSRSSALHAGDTITSIIAFSRLSDVYELMGSRDSAAIVIREAANMFKDHERDDWASQTLSLLIEDEVEKGNVEEAKRIVKYYEGCSGFFDEKHEIEKGREIYYYSKGIYYLGIGRVDSAEWVFRKLIRLAQDMNDTHAAYLGLRKKYLITGPKDSLVKYAMLSESSNDSLYQEHYKANVQQLQKRFNYSRHIENEQRLMLSSERKDKTMLAILLVSSFLILSLFLFFKYRQMLSKRKLVLQTTRYNDLVGMYHSLSHDLDALKAEKFDMASAMAEKESQIETLGRLMAEYDAVVCVHAADDPEMSDELKNLHKKATCGEKATVKELQAMRAVVSEKGSGFVEKLKKLDYMMSFREENICYMIRYGFSASEISMLLGLSPQTLSYFKRKLLKKLFQVEGKASEINDFLCNI